MTLRTTEAVPSGRSVIERPPLSSKVYISFWTMSVVSPTPRRKSSVCSKAGKRISEKPKSAAQPRRTLSRYSQSWLAAGRTSLVPLGMLIRVMNKILSPPRSGCVKKVRKGKRKNTAFQPLSAKKDGCAAAKSGRRREKRPDGCMERIMPRQNGVIPGQTAAEADSSALPSRCNAAASARIWAELPVQTRSAPAAYRETACSSVRTPPQAAMRILSGR